MAGYPIEIGKTVLGGVIGNNMTLAIPEGEKTDNELVLEAIKGRVASFQQLVERHRRKAYLFARGMVHDSDDAYDLSQEAFVRVYKHLRKFDQAYPFRVWLFHILSNLCKNHLRQRKVRDNVVIHSDIAAELAVSESRGPDEVLGQTELQAQVWIGISRLPEKFREIIILSHFQDMPYDQIAKVLDIPRGSVMSRLYYARLKLREILEEMGVEL